MIENNLKSPNDSHTGAIKHLALGDSYTIGEGEIPENTYLFQAVKSLEMQGIIFAPIKVIAKTGWTSGELLQALEKENLSPNSFDTASLLIGVNNQYRDKNQFQFKAELRELIARVQHYLKPAKQNNIVLLSIPDWGVTTFGISHQKPQEQIKEEIDAFNELVKQEAVNQGLHHIEITKHYRKHGGDKENMVSDGLHPNKNIYEVWANLLSKKLKDFLTQNMQ